MSTTRGWRYHAQLEFNGVDPDGVDAPDEVLAHSDHHDDIQLIRRDDCWDVSIYRGDTLDELQVFEDFEAAFAFFSEMVGADR